MSSQGKIKCDVNLRSEKRLPCQFLDVIDFPYYSRNSHNYCIFHAPLDAVMIDDEKFVKSDFDSKIFNDFIIARIKSIASSNESYSPTYMSHIELLEIYPYLKKRFDNNDQLRSQEFRSRVVRNLQESLGARIGLTNLRGVVFPGSFIYQKGTILDADFSYSVFPKECDFSNSTFKSLTNFQFSVFSDVADFSDCKFMGRANFQHSQFSNRLGFENSEFEGPLNLDNCKINQIHVCTTIRKSAASPDQSLHDKSMPELDLSKSEITDLFCIRNRSVIKLNLKNSSFREAPVFAGAAVGDDVVFHNATYEETNPEHANRYSVLKQLCLETGDLIGAEKFRALEFSCMAKNRSTSPFSRWLIRSYGFISNFGIDPLRPLILFFASNSIFTLLYLLLDGISQMSISISAPFWFSLRQILQPFQFFPQGTSISLGIFLSPPLYLALVATVQSLFSYVLIGLSLQAIYRVFNK